MTARPTGSLADLADWTAPALTSWMYEATLREADRLLDEARRLDADGAPARDVFTTLVACENSLAEHPVAQRQYAAHVNTYADRHQIYGWQRHTVRGRGIIPNRIQIRFDRPTGEIR